MSQSDKYPVSVKSFDASEEVEDVKNPLTNFVENSRYDEKTIYDPLGFGGQKVNHLERLHQDVQEVIGEAAEAVKGSRDPYASMIKSLSTDRVFIPVFTSPDVRLGVVEDKPLATMLQRNAVSTQTQRYSEIVTVDNATSFAEGGNIKDSNDTIEKHEYKITRGYGRKYEVTDLMMLAGEEVAPRSVKEQAISESLDRYEEEQGLEGTANDTDGFEGIRDWAGQYGIQDTYSVSDINTNVLREAYNELDKVGVESQNMMLVVSHDDHVKLRNEIDERIRLEPAGELNDGFEVLVFDGAMVVKSSKAQPGTIYGFDASQTRFNMLAETEVKPLAPGDSTRNWAMYRYGHLITEAKSRTLIYEPA